MTAREPINLVQLRQRAHDVERAYDAGPGISNAPFAGLVAAWPAEVLALIDAVEAAHELMPLRHIDPYQPGLDMSIRNLEALDEALTRFTT